MSLLLRSFLAVLLLALAGTQVRAQEPVATGIVMGYQPKAGTITLRSDQTNGMITFYGANKANIFTADGKAGTIESLKLGSRVTVHFATRKDHWYVSKIILPRDAPLPRGIPVNAEPPDSPASQAANDGNITTSADVRQPRVEKLQRR